MFGVWNRFPRLRDVCKACPNTAWLLFLMFSVALVAIVALAVYLSRKRLNLAALGIGIVRAQRWQARPCFCHSGCIRVLCDSIVFAVSHCQ